MALTGRKVQGAAAGVADLARALHNQRVGADAKEDCAEVRPLLISASLEYWSTAL